MQVAVRSPCPHGFMLEQGMAESERAPPFSLAHFSRACAVAGPASASSLGPWSRERQLVAWDKSEAHACGRRHVGRRQPSLHEQRCRWGAQFEIAVAVQRCGESLECGAVAQQVVRIERKISARQHQLRAGGTRGGADHQQECGGSGLSADPAVDRGDCAQVGRQSSRGFGCALLELSVANEPVTLCDRFSEV